MIGPFDGEYRWLSNFWPAKVVVPWGVFPSAEHAFQAAKDPLRIPTTFHLMTPGQAKRWGRNTAQLRPDWELVKRDVMRQCIEAKFGPDNPELAHRLILTGDETLVEVNSWNDTYFGVCNGQGQNVLGVLLMARRLALQLDRDRLLPPT